jgi:hypothetical protein
MNEPAEKPPIGIVPEDLWVEIRMWDLIACLARYKQTAFPYKVEWLIELEQRINQSLRHPKMAQTSEDRTCKPRLTTVEE